MGTHTTRAQGIVGKKRCSIGEQMAALQTPRILGKRLANQEQVLEKEEVS